MEGDLVNRASHNHPLFREDNAEVYYLLEEATRGTSYAASLKPYQRAKDGRGAYFSLRNQYAGRDKWEAELKRQDNLLHTRVWKGQSNFSLEKFTKLVVLFVYNSIRAISTREQRNFQLALSRESI